MANNYGGKRPGAGRKKKDAATRVLNGTATAAELPALTVHGDLCGNAMPPPNEYLTKQSRGAENRGREIYEKLWTWLRERDCHLLINPENLQQYALSLARCEQAENAIHDFGFLAKHPTTGQPIESPYVKIAQKYQKQAQGQWAAIEVNIAERLRHYVDNNSETTDPMEIILRESAETAHKRRNGG
ncbi:MAG: terminase [Firmicutes bacterium]|nr:terminase [Bacillota bacterium]